MTRSPGFGSTARDYAPLSDSVSLRLPYTVKLATNSKSLTHYTKGTQSLLAELLLLVRTRSPGSLPAAMYSLQDTRKRVGFPIRTLPDQSLLPAPRYFSQAATSFIASDRQGIHRVRLFA
ncbi:unnamed protein product [Brugia timori]|uniref:Uncharacterized protein n=1 Tax=Brugia timori TaxID=42155 RepID=A0A0R3R967_9BILA|nr:unnamed protein product [Brugia timori]